jgi:hypothetical protein
MPDSARNARVLRGRSAKLFKACCVSACLYALLMHEHASDRNSASALCLDSIRSGSRRVRRVHLQAKGFGASSDRRNISLGNRQLSWTGHQGNRATG